MREGRQNEGDDRGQPAGKVVRLPRDWLGPREELVPFGRRPTPPESLVDPPESPPSAADFWGEGSAAIHDALQAPTEDPIETAPSSTTPVAAPARRRLAAVAGLAVAAAAVAALASGGFGLRASPSSSGSGAKLNIAAVLNNGVPRMLQRGLAIVGAHTTVARARARPRARAATASRPRPKVARRTAHPRPVFKPVHASVRRQPTPPVSYSAHVSRAAPPSPAAQPTRTAASGGTSDAGITPTRHASSSHPSRATVSPTGESGALGPIQSPNG